MRERILGRAEGVEDRTLTRDDVQASPLLHWAPPGTVTPHSALAVADAYACIRALADAAASLPLHVYRRAEAGRERLDNRTAELIRRPAPATTTANLIGQVVAHLNLHGNAYIGKYRRAGRIEQLGLLAPDRVSVAVENAEPVYTLTHLTGAQTRHSTDDVIHVKALSTDGLVGLSPVRQCQVALGLAEQLATHAATFFANDATPRGLLKLQRFGDAEERIAEIREGWEGTRFEGDLDEFGTHRGPANAHRIAVVSGEVDFTAISMPPEDAQLLESRQFSAQEVARIFRVPPWMIGADSGGSMTYSNVESQSLAFATYALRPWLVTIEQALSADRDLFSGPTYCEFSLDALLRADSKTRAEVYKMALDPVAGYMNRAEVRKLENLPPETAPAPADLIPPSPAQALRNGNGKAKVA